MQSYARILTSYKILDPTKLELLNKPFWAVLFDFKGETLAKNTIINLGSNGKFQLKHELKCKRNASGTIFDVIGEKTENAYYEKYELLGTLHFTYSRELEFKPRDKTIVINALTKLIDVTTLQGDHKEFVGAVLNEAIRSGKRHFSHGINTFEFYAAETKTTFIVHLNFTHALVCHKSDNDPFEYRLEVLGNEIGRGVYGVVFHSDATLFIDQDDILQVKLDKQGNTKKSRRVIKKERISFIEGNEIEHGYQTPQAVMKTYHVLRQTPHSSAKEPVIIRNANSLIGTGFTVSKFFPGKGLNEITAEISGNPEALSTDMRLRYMRNILYAAKAQIKDRGLVHRDIKKENILVTQDQANIIDYNLSKLATDNDAGKNAGSLLYIPSEVWLNQNTTFKADIFTLAPIMAYLCGATDLFDLIFTKDEAIQHAKNRTYENLFEGLHDLAIPHKEDLRRIIYAMSHADAIKREDIELAIKIVEEIILQRKFNLSGQINFSQQPQYAQLKLAHDRVNELKNLLELNLKKSYEILETNIAKSLEQVDDKPEIISEFVSVLNLSILQKARTKADIINTVTQAVTAFKQALNALAKRKTEYSQLQPPASAYFNRLTLCARIVHAEAQMNLTCITLDDVVGLTKKLNKAIVKIDEEFVAIQETVRTNVAVFKPRSKAFLNLFNLQQVATNNGASNPVMQKTFIRAAK